MESYINNLINDLKSFVISQKELDILYDWLIIKSTELTDILIENKIEPYLIEKISYIPTFLTNQKQIGELSIKYYTLQNKKDRLIEILSDSYYRKHFLKTNPLNDL